MKTNLLLSAVFATAGFSAFSARADEPTPQPINIVKINQVIATAKDKVLPEFSDWIQSANLSIDQSTFDLDQLSVGGLFDATVKKSSWSEQPTTVRLNLQTSLQGNQQVPDQNRKLQVSASAQLKTQVLTLAKFLANKVLEEVPPSQNDTAGDLLARGYFTDVINAEDLNSVITRTLALPAQVEGLPEGLDNKEVKEFFAALKFERDQDSLKVVVKDFEFYDVTVSASFVLDEASVGMRVRLLDVGDNFKKQYEEMKESIREGLLSLQNADDQVRTGIEDAIRSLLSAAREMVGVGQSDQK